MPLRKIDIKAKAGRSAFKGTRIRSRKRVWFDGRLPSYAETKAKRRTPKARAFRVARRLRTRSITSPYTRIAANRALSRIRVNLAPKNKPKMMRPLPMEAIRIVNSFIR